jgi:cytolysin (calcineurin-like family phosphatase)
MEKIIIKKEKLKKMIEEWIHYPFYNGLDLEDFDEDIVIFDIDNFVRRIKKVKIRFTPPPPFLVTN